MILNVKIQASQQLGDVQADTRVKTVSGWLVRYQQTAASASTSWLEIHH